MSELRITGRGLQQVVARLDALLMVTKSCKAQSCHAPWQTLHPDAKITTLALALDPKYDNFYKQQPKVAFDSCEMGYLIQHEGPQHVNVWDREDALSGHGIHAGGQQVFGHWSWWN